MDLKEARALFCSYQASLLVYAQTKFSHLGYIVAFEEGRILPERKGIPENESGHPLPVEPFQDRVHKQNSYHYSGLAIDFICWKLDPKAGKILPVSGSDQIWVDLASFWVSLHPSCRAGLNFKNPQPDPCHFEFAIYG